MIKKSQFLHLWLIILPVLIPAITLFAMAGSKIASAQGLPPQPTNLTARHRSGQTFLTWTERGDLNGETYRVYRHSQPIISTNLADATLLYEVPEDSAWFFANRHRSSSAPSGWQNRYLDRYVIQDGGSELAAGTGLLVWTLAITDFNGAGSGNGYYAVTTVAAGVENDATFDSGNAIGPVSESVTDPQPVELSTGTAPGWHTFIQFMDLRVWNPTFHAPRSGNDYYGFDPGNPASPVITNSIQYAYDYAVYVPQPSACGGTLPAQLPVLVNLHAWQGNWYDPPSNAPNSYCAYTLNPIDVSETWWFGFARNHDFRLGGWPGAGDTIVNYTEQRILRMIADLINNPIEPAVDVDRIYVRGYSMGAGGTLAMALRYSNIFAAAHADKPMTNHQEENNWRGDAEDKWGSVGSELPVAIAAPNGWADHLSNHNGDNIWDWQNHQLHLQLSREDDAVPLGITQGSNDTGISWNTQGEPFYLPLNASGQMWGVQITDDNHDPGNYRGLPPNLQLDANGIPFWGLQVVRTETVPGFTDLSENPTTSPNITPTTIITGSYNQTVRWSASWDNWDGAPIDSLLQWQMSFCAIDADPAIHDCGTGITQTVAITPRRLQQFNITPDVEYSWRNELILDGTLVAGGVISADADGLLTVPDFEITPQGNRLIISAIRSKIFLPIVIKP